MRTGSLDAVYQSANDKLSSGDAAAATEELTDALQSSPDDGQLWELLGLAELANGHAGEAVAALEQATCLVPLTNSARLALAHGYELIGKEGLARDLYVVLAESRDLPADMLEPLARGLGRSSEPYLALRICAKAAAVMPEATAPLMGMAFYLRQLRRPPEEVLPVLFRAFHLDPSDFGIRLTVARVLQMCGQSQEAAQLLSSAPITGFLCASCLRAMQSIFEEVGDDDSKNQKKD